MKRILLFLFLISFAVSTASAQTQYFNVRVENPSPSYMFGHSGVFNTPVGETGPGPIGPGGAYEFSLMAAPGSYLSLATMFVQSNDLFYAPDEMGIPLYDENGDPRSGDVTSYFMLWDGGTEVNEEPGEGPNQAPRQSGPDTGDDENGVVQLVSDSFTYPAVDAVLKVTLTHDDEVNFTVRIENVSTSSTLSTSMGQMLPVPLAPGVWVVHTTPAPLFTSGEADRGEGLEGLAEDGNAGILGDALSEDTGLTSILSPGTWAVHTDAGPFFTAGEADRGMGLEAIAEDGNPGMLAAMLAKETVTTGGAFTTPVGAEGPAPAGPGGAYEFTIAAMPGSYLSLNTMFVQSNDLFLAPDEMGIPLWDANGDPMSGDITSYFMLWDAGTEVNQVPGLGNYQAPRQPGPNMGMVEGGTVRLVDDGYTYPMMENVLKVTLTPLETTLITIVIENVSTETTLPKSAVAVPLAPGNWTVHTAPAPLFTDGEADRGLGLEAVAEDGNPAMLGMNLANKLGLDSGVFNTPVGASGPAPIGPGGSYAFTIAAAPGSYLSLATMFVQSNDLFYSPDEMGIPLFDENGDPVAGDITSYFMLWDGGTEVNEEPGKGPNQAPRQSGPNTGDDENGVVQLVSDGFTYPAVTEVIRVTATATATAIEEAPEGEALPQGFTLHQNYPNPFNPETRITFDLQEGGNVSLSVYNVLGQRVASLLTGYRAAGTHQVTWKGRDANGNQVATGLYFYRLELGQQSQMRQMVLLK